ncbi:sister chromatid cohesion 1 protein 4-like isoform X1 [Canna indica]|uniref:Sister chromatid cohesion 1 protein 4-like isoform X1 n=1 Tax=Canna indica TaxID=4628 RepID=A0AAQ3QRI0_9LILI|nr:sister chromatid cohesion 1 protein 4-like isoform X1 [Canna indica]
MFYSQFILAKKGPLGTIWIAAHLERKLRKNQVADTDIGVSVDSILFPDVPIALRLSSHLLLGVVRIYSKKVNYLFHDCSEALLKIKQAFRATAVDLPPEESTAPYHSITLPETFDLDDFELPDSAFQGDFVDHHVSSKDQITLQDTVDGMGFSSLQFGSDERFGDGNGSQIGLDLDEVGSSCQSSSSVFLMDMDVDDKQNVMVKDTNVETPMDMDADDKQNVFVKDTNVETPMDHPELSKYPNNHVHSDIEVIEKNDVSHWQGYNIQTPDLSEVFSANDHNEGQTGHRSIADMSNLESAYGANAPSTPGLIEEVILTPIPESPALGPQQIHSPSFGETLKTDNFDVQCACPDLQTGSALEHQSMVESKSDHGAEVASFPTVLLEEKQPTTLDEHCEQQSMDNQNLDGENVLPEEAQMENLVSHSFPLEASNSQVPLDKSVAEIQDVTAITSSINSNVETQPSRNHELEEADNPCLKTTDSSLSSDFQLRCTSEFNESDMHSVENGEPVQGAPEVSVEDREKALPDTECMEKQGTESFTEIANTNELSVVDSQKDTNLDQLNCCFSPEKMRLAQTGDVDQGKELSLLTVEKGIAESDGSVNRIISLSGKKRHVMDSESVLPIDSSAKMSGRKSFRSSTDCIPDDDDLLASILVGKRTPLLKIDQTPSLPKATSQKRPRAMAKLGMLRKTLLDDTTVLHADAIRQQLMHTEDIRRIRKKAPCTRPEIWMIQKSSAEDEIFNEPITTGMGEELSAFHSQVCGYEANDKERRKPMLPNTNAFEGQESPVVSVSADVGSSKVATSCDAQEHSHCMIDVNLSTETTEQEKNGEIGMPTTSFCSSDRMPDEGLANIENDVGGIADEKMHTVTDNDTLERVEVDCAATVPTSFCSSDRMPDEGLAIIENDVGGIADEKMHTVTDNDTLECVEVDCAATVPLITEGKSSVDAVNPSVVQDTFVEENECRHPLVSTIDSCLPQVDQNLPKDMSTVIGTRDNQLDARVEDVAIAQIVLDSKENVIPDNSFSERSEMADASSPKTHSDIHNIPSAVGENSSFLEFNLAGDVGAESPINFAAAKECSDFCSAIDGNGTEFLNDDDEADCNEAADDEPNPEEAQSLENSGWSSRTRAVARYLKNIFDGDYGYGRKSIAMDHLIAGKTRKEASRMFFETLVLKTKDYIHVEQQNPCSYINIEPRAKLLKSEF